MHFLGLDVSTQSVSATIIDTHSSTIVAEESVNFGAALPQYNAPSGFIVGGKDDEVHADPLMWLDALELLLSKMKNDGVDFSKISAISGAGQQHASVYLDSSFEDTLTNLNTQSSLSKQLGKCLARSTSPIWMDSSTVAECAEIAAAVGSDAEVCALSGSLVTARFTGPQIRKFYKDSPDEYAHTTTIHLNSSFLSSIFSGQSSPIDTGDGAGMNLMNLSSEDWDNTLLEATAPELKTKLPSVDQAGSLIGNISSYFVQKYGFSEECRALVWTGDNPASLVGMGAANPGQMVVSLGTSDTLFAAMPEPKTAPNGYGHVFGNPLGGYMSLICFANGSLAREKVKDTLEISWDEFERDALTQPKVENKDKFALPFFTPEVTPRVAPNKVCTNGWDFDAEPNSVKIRAILDGQFLNMRYHTLWMEISPEKILITGGASKNRGIAQCVANVFDQPVMRLSVSSSVALGSAFLAAINQGHRYDSLVAAFCPIEGEMKPSDEVANYTQTLAALGDFIDPLVQQSGY